MNDITRPSPDSTGGDRFPGSPVPAVASRPQALAGGRSPLPDVRRRPLRQRIDHLLATFAGGLVVVDPRDAMLAAGILGVSPAGLSRRVRADALDTSDGRAEA